MSFVYIMTNKRNTVLYTGVTADLKVRATQHKAGIDGTFTSKYQITKLVYYEPFEDITLAIACEKQIKGGSRARKQVLVERDNPTWRDLFDEI